MKSIKQQVNGRFLEDEPDGIVWDETADPIYLRYAFVTLGREEHILPAFLLDDWGNEKKGVALYSWVEKNGPYFPRAEIFGFTPDGQKTQIFLRELDLIVKYRCYAYQSAETPLSEGRLIEKIYLPGASVGEAVPVKQPADIPYPLSKSAVKWLKART